MRIERDINYKNNETLLIFLFFIISRIIYKFFFNIQFDSWTLTAGVYDQFFPINLLKDDLLQSLIYNALQPPLLNLITGILIKITSNYLIYIELIFLVCGFLNFIFFNKILIEINFSKKKRLLFTIALMVLPTTVLYENHFYKEYPAMFLITVLVYLSIRIIKLKIENQYISYKKIILFGITLSALLLLRETFNIFWGWIFLIFLLVVTKEYKKFIICIIIFNILVLPFYLKNYFLYDRFGINLQFWRGMNGSVDYIRKMQNNNYDQNLKKIFFKNDENFQSFIAQMSPIYNEIYDQDGSNFILLLKYKHKYNNSLLHSKTYFNEVFIKVDEYRAADIKKFIKYHPEIIIFHMSQTLARHFFRSSDVFYFIKPNARKIPNLLRLTSCLKITLSCIFETHFVEIQTKKRLIQGTENLYLEDDEYDRNFKNLILYTLYDTNFILVILYVSLLFYFIKNFLRRNQDKLTLLINFWMLTFFYIFTGLIIMENLEMGRQRFPFDYLSIIFLIYYIKNSHKFNKIKSTT